MRDSGPSLFVCYPNPSTCVRTKTSCARDPNSILVFFHFPSYLTCPSPILLDNWLKLDDSAQVLAYAAIVKRLTDPANFESFRFMPVTRDMSRGERTLLYNFLNTAPGEIAVGAAATTQRNLGVAQLSRAMRSG